METKKYTIEDLREGKVAIVNDGTIEALDKVVKYAFDLFVKEDESNRYLFKMGVKYGTSNGTELPTQSIKVFLEEIEQIEKKQMETKELKVGDYIRGFKYDCPKDLEEHMNSHVGDIGIIVQKHSRTIKVKFQDNSTWWYPNFLAIEHLCNQDMIDFEKGLDANAKEFLKPLETSVIDNTIEEMLKDAEDPLEDTPFHKPDFSHLRDKINPSHYKRLPKETIERIQDNLTPEEFKGYLKGNILKYLDRYENKNGVEDLKKANWYLNKLIEIENEK